MWGGSSTVREALRPGTPRWYPGGMLSWFKRRPDPSEATPPVPDPSPPAPETSEVGLGFDGGSTIYVGADTRHDNDRIRAVVDSLRDVSQAHDVHDLLVRMVDRAVRVVKAERGLLFLSGSDEDGKPILRVARSFSGEDLPRQAAWSTRVVQDVLSTQEAVCLKLDGDGGKGFDPSQSMLDLAIRAVMCVPLRAGDTLLGAIYVDMRATSREFSRADLRFFEAFADMLAIAWQNRNAEQERLFAERARQELELARTIQSDLVPNRPPHVPGYGLAGRMRPADEMSGDYFDFFVTSDGKLAMAIGDVTGHGVGAALVMTTARAALRAFCEDDSSPGRVLARVNRHLVASTNDMLFMSLFLGVVDLASGELRYCNAGHPSPVQLCGATGAVTDLRVTGVALGVDEDSDYDEDSVVVGSGDSLVMFTDGLNEIRKGDEQYGRPRIVESVTSRAGASADELLAGVFDDAVAWNGADAASADDVTIAVLRAEAPGH